MVQNEEVSPDFADRSRVPTMEPVRVFLFGAPVALVASITSVAPASAHDIEVPRKQLSRDVRRLTETLRFYRERPPSPSEVRTDDDQRRLLGAAEIEMALGDQDRALEILMGRLADPRFQALPEYVGTLLLTSQILEDVGENAGAMFYAEIALRKGGTPEQMAEAGARWFRVARRSRRLGRRQEMYALWKRQGGERAAGTEQAAQVRYEVAFALRADGRYADALKLLQQVPSEANFGSRAAYLAGVVFVEYGDLANAERWFSAIMDWPLPTLEPDDPQLKIENKVRQLAALSTGRLRYERTDLEGAAEAYARVPPDSPYGDEACWEQAYLSLERTKRRKALKYFQCVVDLGAKGQRGLEARMFKASLLAHLERYTDSIESYKVLHKSLQGQHELFSKAASGIERPGPFLFEAKDRADQRGTVEEGETPSPGPATLFADAWTADVERAYRVDRGGQTAAETLDSILASIDEVSAAVQGGGAFVGFKVRRQYLEILLREVRHLEGHAGQTSTKARLAHSSGPSDHNHTDDLQSYERTIAHLRELGRAVESDLSALEKEEGRRRREAESALSLLRTDVVAIRGDLIALQQASGAPVDGVAREAITLIQAALRDAAMKAEFGVLDTYWLKKQHRTRAVEALLQQQKETERQVGEALDAAP